jgi:hypothetical protein
MSCGEDCTCKGTKDVHDTDYYRNMLEHYRKGFKDGVEFARSNPYLSAPVVPNDGLTQDMTGCRVCGMNFGTGVWGYVCNNPKCPTRVTC